MRILFLENGNHRRCCNDITQMHDTVKKNLFYSITWLSVYIHHNITLVSAVLHASIGV